MSLELSLPLGSVCCVTITLFLCGLGDKPLGIPWRCLSLLRAKPGWRELPSIEDSFKYVAGFQLGPQMENL